MISGYTVTRDCLSNDYCIEEAIRSMLPVCEEVIVSDMASKDGTRELVEALAKETGKIKLIDYPRKDDLKCEKDFLVKWANSAREKCRHKYQLYIEADEVLDPVGSNELLIGEKRNMAFWFQRLNFWKDTQHLAPAGHVCSNKVIRSGPQSMWMPMDCMGLHPRDKEFTKYEGRSGMRIFHYGFLRKQEHFFRKAKFFLPAYCGSYDPRLEKAEQQNKPWWSYFDFDGKPLVDFNGKHPKIAIKWLTDRGYTPRT